MQKIIFVFLVLAGVALAADKTITDKVRKQQITHIRIYQLQLIIPSEHHRIIIHIINNRHFICGPSAQSAFRSITWKFFPFKKF